MKQDRPSQNSASLDDFIGGRVFGFDLGTVGIAHAVRTERELVETGVLECPNETAALAGRRKLRNGRRVMDHRQDRRNWFSQALAGVLGLELHDGCRLPKTSWQIIGDGLLKPSHPRVGEPLSLRVAALNGDALTPDQLFMALAHLVKRRGPARPPWADNLPEEDNETDETPDATRVSPDETRSRFERAKAAAANPAGYHPCHYLQMLRDTKQRQRNHAWPRELMRAEAAAIMEAQSVHYPVLKEKREVTDVTGKTLYLTTAEWLLRGNAALLTKAEASGGSSFDVFHRNHRNRERAPFTFQAARIHNRGPGLDLIHPRREDGGRNYVMSRSHPEYRAWQVEVALLNFRVANLSKRPNSKGKFPNMTVPPEAMESLKLQIAAKLKKLATKEGDSTNEETEDENPKAEDETEGLKKKKKDEVIIFSLDDLKRWEEPYRKAGVFQLQDGQRDLVGKAKGRGKFGKHGLEDAWRILRQLQEMNKPLDAIKPASNRQQKKLKSRESRLTAFVQKQQPEYLNMAPRLRQSLPDQGRQTCGMEPLPRALKRFIDEIRDPVVQHRVQLFDQLLNELIERHGPPTHIVVECVREFNTGTEDAQKAKTKRDTAYKENNLARKTLKAMGLEANDKNIRKFRLLQECKWRCPYNPDDRFMQSEFDELVLHRLVPPADDQRRSAYLKAARQALTETEIEHMVPQSNIVCDEWFNVTVTRRKTNDAKKAMIPYEFVLRDADETKRERLIQNAESLFGKDSLKFKIFTSPDARSLIDSSANLNRTAYIARCVRYVCLLKFGWLTADGRDPLQEPGHEVNTRYLVSNGGITHRLRKAWQLDELLHEDQLTDEEWSKLTDEQKDEIIAKRRQKNRQDLRHHALDAMILCCTLPWAASSPDFAGGWCHLDPQDGSVSSVACPIFGRQDHGQMIKELAAEKLLNLKQSDPQDPENHDRIQHYRSNNKHAAVFDTSLYGRRTEFAGEKLDETVFVIRKPLGELTANSLDPSYPGNVIFSPKLRKHVKNEWINYTSDPSNWTRVVSCEITRVSSDLDAARTDTRISKSTIAAKERTLFKLKKWQEIESPDHKTWEMLQEHLFSQTKSGVPKAVFPSDFIATLKHPDYTHAPLRRVKVTHQTKDEGTYMPVRNGTYLKYKGGFKCMKVYDAPPGSSRGSAFICWLVRPFYPNPRKLRNQDLLEENKPEVCKGRKLRATFKGGDVVRFQHDIQSKSIKAGTNWMICSMETKKNYNASFEIVPAHLALNAQDINNPRKSVSSKDTDGKKVSLNDFMRALGYEPAHHPSSES